MAGMTIHPFDRALALACCCLLGCGSRTASLESGDEIVGEESESTDGESTDGESTESTGEECPPQPEVIGCVVGQDCPEGFKCGGWSGEDCYGQSGGDSACVPVLGDQGAGQACTTFEEQATAIFTWHLDDCDAETRCKPHSSHADEGTCVPYCEWDGMEASCDPSRLCKGGPPALCLQRCDPTAAEPTCEGEFVCGASQYSNAEFYCGSSDFDPGEGQLGDDCVSAFTCENGLGCVDGECQPFCSLTDIDPCIELGPGFTCMPFYDEGQAPASLEHVGLCAMP